MKVGTTLSPDVVVLAVGIEEPEVGPRVEEVGGGEPREHTGGSHQGDVAMGEKAEVDAQGT